MRQCIQPLFRNGIGTAAQSTGDRIEYRSLTLSKWRNKRRRRYAFVCSISLTLFIPTSHPWRFSSAVHDTSWPIQQRYWRLQ